MSNSLFYDGIIAEFIAFSTNCIMCQHLALAETKSTAIFSGLRGDGPIYVSFH